MNIIKIITLIILIFTCFQSNTENYWWWRKKNNIQLDTIYTNIDGKGYNLCFEFKTGKGHNNPSFAIWIENMNGEFIQELFVTKSVATGIFRYGDSSTGKWKAGERRYQAALPYFFHKRAANYTQPEIPCPEKPVLDAFTGATPKNNFNLKTKTCSKELSKFRVLFELNQTWDFNNYWHNAKFPDDNNYRSSAQPSLIYAVTIDTENLMQEYFLNPIGHGHYSGADGNLYTDLSNFTSALEIFEKIKLIIKK